MRGLGSASRVCHRRLLGEAEVASGCGRQWDVGRGSAWARAESAQHVWGGKKPREGVSGRRCRRSGTSPPPLLPTLHPPKSLSGSVFASSSGTARTAEQGSAWTLSPRSVLPALLLLGWWTARALGDGVVFLQLPQPTAPSQPLSLWPVLFLVPPLRLCQ